ncbi:MAG: phosphotransferase [Thiolinea sp.]
MISADLQQQIMQQLSQCTGCDDWVISESVIEARECVVYKISSSSYPRAVAIKIYRDRQPKKNKVMPQYAALKRFSALLNQADSEFRVPQAYGSFPEQRVFLMEWIDAPALERRLWRYCYSKNIQQSDMRRTFAWLNHFHQQGDLSAKPVNINRYPNRLQQFIVDHEGAALLVANKIFRRGFECIKELANQFRGMEVAHARLHGDFTPANILLGDDVVTAIDITGVQLLPVAEDITLQLSYIAIGYPNMLTRMDFKHPPDTWPLLSVILDAYGYPQDEEQRRFLLYVFLYQLLRRWLVIAHRNKSRSTPLLDRWRLRNSEMIVDGVSRALQEACRDDGRPCDS